MDEIPFFTEAEKAELAILYKKLYQSAGDSITKKHIRDLKNILQLEL